MIGKIADRYEVFWKECRHKTLILILVYTMLFAMIMPVGVSQYFEADRSWVQQGNDALQQTSTLMGYWGHMLRDGIRGIFSGNANILTFDFSMGLGDDAFSILSWQAFYPIFCLVSVLTPEKYVEIGYLVFVVIQYYLAGLAFMAFGVFMKKRKAAILCGALIYAFSGWSFYYGMRHCMFTVPLVLMPLLLIGIEKMLRLEKPFFLIVTTFVALISNIYFFISMSVFVVLYAFFRYFELYPQRTLKHFSAVFFKSAGAYLLGIMLGCFVLFPAVLSFFSSARSVIQMEADSLLVYPKATLLYYLLYSFGQRVRKIIIGRRGQGRYAARSEKTYTNKETQNAFHRHILPIL